MVTQAARNLSLRCAVHLPCDAADGGHRVTHRERVIKQLRDDGPLCDDCLSGRSGIRPRQSVNQVAHALQQGGLVGRTHSVCPSCGKSKLVNSLAAQYDGKNQVRKEPRHPRGEHVPASPDQAWHWEGNVQARIVTYLVENGHAIRAVADTASRAPGRDIEAETPDGKTLWVSVKGFPERSANTQARHWFSQAMFDMILYRAECPKAEFAVGLPAGFATYENLSPRTGWFKDAVPFRIFWVYKDGRVEVE